MSMYNWCVDLCGVTWPMEWGEVCVCILRVKGEIGLQFSEISWNEENDGYWSQKYDFNVPV